MATFPYHKFPNTEVILYTDHNKEFAIASGYDSEDPQNANGANVLSVGIRWLVSRADAQKQKPLGYPHSRGAECWFIMPNDLAANLLRTLIGKDSSKDVQIVDAIHKLI